MKRTLSIILTVILLFSVLPLTTLTASAYNGYEQYNICSWWDGTDLKWHAVSGATYYALDLRVFLPKGESAYEVVQLKSISFDLKNGTMSGFYEDGTLNENFNVDKRLTYSGNTITMDVEKWLGIVSSSFLYYYELTASGPELTPGSTVYKSTRMPGADLLNGYKGLGGIIKLSNVSSTGEASTGSFINATVTDCSVPVSSLHYEWRYFDHYYDIQNNSLGTPVPNAVNGTTLYGVSRDLLGKYVCLIATADGYDGVIYSPRIYYAYHTVTVDGGTALCTGDNGSTIKAQKGDLVFLTADDSVGFTVWGVTSGGVTIDVPTKAENATFYMGDSDVQIKANYSASGYTVSGTITSFLDEAGQVEIQLVQPSTMTMIADEFVTGNTVSYSIPNVPEGTYTISVLKKNHVTKSGKLTVSGDTTQDVKIHPIGDINGDGTVNNFDFGRVNSHARGKSTLTGYEFSCGDVNGDNNINNFDAGRINSHARGKSSLWT